MYFILPDCRSCTSSHHRPFPQTRHVQPGWQWRGRQRLWLLMLPPPSSWLLHHRRWRPPAEQCTAVSRHRRRHGVHQGQLASLVSFDISNELVHRCFSNKLPSCVALMPSCAALIPRCVALMPSCAQPMFAMRKQTAGFQTTFICNYLTFHGFADWM